MSEMPGSECAELVDLLYEQLSKYGQVNVQYALASAISRRNDEQGGGIYALRFSNRTRYALHRGGFSTVNSLKEFVNTNGAEELQRFRGIGSKAVAEVKLRLQLE